MHVPAFLAAGEMLTLIQVPGFRIAAEGEAGSSLGHCLVDQFAETVDTQFRDRLTAQPAAGTQVEHDCLPVCLNDASRVTESHAVSTRARTDRRPAGHVLGQFVH